MLSRILKRLVQLRAGQCCQERPRKATRIKGLISVESLSLFTLADNLSQRIKVSSRIWIKRWLEASKTFLLPTRASSTRRKRHTSSHSICRTFTPWTRWRHGQSSPNSVIGLGSCTLSGRSRRLLWSRGMRKRFTNSTRNSQIIACYGNSWPRQRSVSIYWGKSWSWHSRASVIAKRSSRSRGIISQNLIPKRWGFRISSRIKVED